MERITIFIDNSNIFKGFQKYNVQVDYEKLKTLITRDRKLSAIYLYEGVVYPMSQGKKNWYQQLSKRSGYEIKASFDKIAKSVAIEKKVDINIAIDVVSLAYEDAYDTAVLVSGDGDFLPVIKKVKELNKIVEIWAFKYSLANTIREELEDDKVFLLDDFLNEIQL
ncbi:MAG: LabA-like NYN domain-containing protein [Promethearchaeota archaeon]|jgi:uncharacterized LabA/DUF88 family protein